MFNRKKIERLEKRIRTLENKNTDLNRIVAALTQAHLNEPDFYEYTDLDGNVRYYPRFFHMNGDLSAFTRECGDVTFAELVRYVIDKEPIAREVTTTKYFEHPDNCRSSAEDTEDD